MKKLRLFLLIVLVLCFASLSYGQGALKASTELTSSSLITPGPGYFCGIMVSTDGTNAVTIDVYGNTTAAVPKLMPTWTVTSSSVNRAQTYNVYPPIKSDGGIYVNVSVAGGGSVKYMVYYQ